MRSANAILKVLFVVLLIIIVFELIYYLYFIYQKNTPNASVISAQPTSVIIPDPRFSADKLFPSSYPEQALPENQLSNLRVLKKGLIKSFLIQYVFEGKVALVEPYGDENFKGFHLRVQADNGDQNNFYYGVTEADVFIDNGKQPIDFTNIKVGDNIKGEVYFDILTGNFTNNVRITIIR